MTELARPVDVPRETPKGSRAPPSAGWPPTIRVKGARRKCLSCGELTNYVVDYGGRFYRFRLCWKHLPPGIGVTMR